MIIDLMETTPSKVSQLDIHAVEALSEPGKAVAAACPTADHLLAYVANSFVVIHDTSTNKQVSQLRSTTSNQPLQCVAWSCCGTHLAAGEMGSNAAIYIWDHSSGKCAHELRGHKATVGKLCFSPDGKLLASIGCGADGHLCIWNWHSGSLLCKQKVTGDLTGVVFTEDSSHVLAAGRTALKSWSLSWSSPRPGRSRSSGGGANGFDTTSNALSLTERQVNLKQQRASSFVDLCLAPSGVGQPVGSVGVYALTDKGNLLLLRPTGRTVDRSINLQVREAFGLAATSKLVGCACAQGVVRLFSSKSLAFRANLPYWTAAGSEDSSHFADARACSFGPGSQSDSLLLVAYSNHEMVLWDIHDLAEIFPVRSFSSHAGSIWDVCSFCLPDPTSDLITSSSSNEDVGQQAFSCATCGSDGSIRFWGAPDAAGSMQPLASVHAGLPAYDSSSSSSAQVQPPRGKVQLRCMRVSADGRLLAVGDTAGNVHVYDVATLKLLVVQEAHDSDVLCLDFSPPPQQQQRPGSAAAKHSSKAKGGRDGRGLAVSGSRDMLVHVYDACNGFRLLETLDDHKAEVTAVRFTAGGRGLVSCGADHSIIFRVLGSSPGAHSAYGYKQTHRQVLQHTLLYDLVVDPLDGYVLTADQGGVMRQWDAATGGVLRAIQPEVGAGQVLRLCMDPGGVLAMCCHSDGCVRLYDMKSGSLMWRAWGHAAHVAAAALSPDLTQLLSVGGDGCILVWKLPGGLVQQLQAAAREVVAAREQAGCCMPSPPQLPANNRSSLSAVPEASPNPAGPAAAAALGGLGTPQQAGSAGGSNAVTPGSSSSDGGFSSILKRIQQGKPLVSADKLPRWARSPTAAYSRPAAAAAAPCRQQSASEGGAQPLPQQRNRWLERRKQAAGDSSSRTASDPGTQGESSVVEDANACAQPATVSEELPQEQQQPALPWHHGAARKLVRHWQDGSSFSKEAAAMAAAAAAADAGKGHTSAAGGVGVPEGPGPTDQLSPPPTAEQQPDLPGKAQSPAPQGTAALVRDLFKSDFSSPKQPVRGPAKAQEPAEEDDCLAVQQDRQSFSAKFKRERSSPSQVGSPLSDMGTQGKSPAGSQPAAAADAFTSSLLHEQSTGLTPQGSRLFRAMSGALPPAPAPSPAAPAATGADGGHPEHSRAAATKRPCSQDMSPREKRWRQGQKQAELASMMEKLECLQSEFAQQTSRLSPCRPARPNSSLGHASPAAQQQQQQVASRRRSDSSAGCILALACEQQQQQQQSMQQLPQTPGKPSLSAAGPDSPGRSPLARGPAAASLSPAPVSHRQQQASSTSKHATRQPWASPMGSNRSASRTVKRSPASSPTPSYVARRQQQQQQAGPSRRSDAGSDLTQNQGVVFGSRTQARALQRRRSSHADDPAADAEADAAASQQDTSCTPTVDAAASPAVVYGLSPVAPKADTPAASPLTAGTPAAAVDSTPAEDEAAVSASAPAKADAAAPAPPGPSGNAQLMAALFGDDSPAASPSPSPAAAAATPGNDASSARGPNPMSRIARLLAADSSPEGASPPARSEAVAATAAAASPGSRSSTQSPTSRHSRLPRLQDVLQGASNNTSPNSRAPSGSCSPARSPGPLLTSHTHKAGALTEPLVAGSATSTDKSPSPSPSPSLGALLASNSPLASPCSTDRGPEGALSGSPTGPMASPCSPQARQQQGAGLVARARAPSGIPSLQGASRKLQELPGRVDVSSECRVSIGTSIAARSPQPRAPAPGSPLAHAPTVSDRQPCDSSAAAAAPTAATADAFRSSVDLTPVPAGVVLYSTPHEPTCKVSTASAAAGGSAQQPAAAAASPEHAAAGTSKAGALVTPAGMHQVWPAWGTGGALACEATPSPGAEAMKKMWPPAAAGQGPDAAAASPQGLMRSNPMADAAESPADSAAAAGASSPGLIAEESSVSTFVGSEAPLLPSGGGYWVAQNPCYDMTPHGSAGRGKRASLGLGSTGGGAGTLPDAPDSCGSLQRHAVKDLFAATRMSGVATACEGGVQQRTAVSPTAAGVAEDRDDVCMMLSDVSRYTSCASVGSTTPPPAGIGLEQQLPATPPSAGGSSLHGSEAGSIGSSRGGWRPGSSGSGGRFSGRGLTSLLGQGPSRSGPDSECRPASPAGMLGLLQRMRMSLPKGKTKSGRSSDAGGCLSPQVSEGGGMYGTAGPSPAHMPASRQQQQQGWRQACSGDSSCALSADDINLDVSSRSAASVTPSYLRSGSGRAGSMGAPGQLRTVQQVAATVGHFKQSIAEMQALLQQLQGLDLDDDSTQEIHKLLAAPNAPATQGQASAAAASQPAAAAGEGSQGRPADQAHAGSTCSNNSSSVLPPVPLQQRLQQEVLQSISELHATITGLSLVPSDASTSEASAGLPAWPPTHSSSRTPQQLCQQHQQHASSPGAQQGHHVSRPASRSTCDSSQGGPALAQALAAAGLQEEQLCAHIANVVLQRLGSQAAGCRAARQE